MHFFFSVLWFLSGLTFFYLGLFWNNSQLYSWGWPWTLLLQLIPEDWDYRHALPCLLYVVLEIKSKTLYIIGKLHARGISLADLPRAGIKGVRLHCPASQALLTSHDPSSKEGSCWRWWPLSYSTRGGRSSWVSGVLGQPRLCRVRPFRKITRFIFLPSFSCVYVCMHACRLVVRL